MKAVGRHWRERLWYYGPMNDPFGAWEYALPLALVGLVVFGVAMAVWKTLVRG